MKEDFFPKTNTKIHNVEQMVRTGYRGVVTKEINEVNEIVQKTQFEAQ